VKTKHILLDINKIYKKKKTVMRHTLRIKWSHKKDVTVLEYWSRNELNIYHDKFCKVADALHIIFIP
jgi:hypothetical protein